MKATETKGREQKVEQTIGRREESEKKDEQRSGRAAQQKKLKEAEGLSGSRAEVSKLKCAI